MIKDRNDMVDLMVELLETEISEPDYIPTARGREIINEIADYAEGTDLFAARGSLDVLIDCLVLALGDELQRRRYSEVFAYMLDRCESAPTMFHMSASIILLMPFVRRKLLELEVTT